VVRIYTKAIAWLYDPTNRSEAIQILMKVSKLKQDDVERAYDYLINGRYFEPTGRISKSRLGKLVDALRSLGDVPPDFTVERLFLPGITQVSD
jgi:DNA-directed RNA polymerase subunit F